MDGHCCGLYAVTYTCVLSPSLARSLTRARPRVSRALQEGQPPSSIFLRELDPVDASLGAAFASTDSWKMMQILRGSFRQLDPPSPAAAQPVTIARHAAPIHARAEGQVGDYQLMR